MTLTELKTKANTKLATFWTQLQTKQDAYYAKHGKYFQLLISPSSQVVDGVDSDFTTTHPHDEKHQIDVDFAWSDKIPFQISVSDWVGPPGEGYSATVTVELPNGDIYKRTRNNDNTDTGWKKEVDNVTNK